MSDNVKTVRLELILDSSGEPALRDIRTGEIYDGYHMVVALPSGRELELSITRPEELPTKTTV